MLVDLAESISNRSDGTLIDVKEMLKNAESALNASEKAYKV